MLSRIDLLLCIAKRAGLKSCDISTIRIAKLFRISQQTISRRLIEYDKEGLITRQILPKGIRLSLTKKGFDLLQEHYLELRAIFEKRINTMAGTIESGLGEGKFYIEQQGYQEQFRKRLGFKAYPGTLNLRVDLQEFRNFLSAIPPVAIAGFKTDKRTFGSITAYPVTFRGMKGAIIVPERTIHDQSTMEIIAPDDLRQRFRLKDGGRFEVEHA
ncbi:DUF120 domain-containing protein [Candidatus Woesearchaeota archaeon]|nr:DUF120 domain-containing protein [Candidatus Woesearchaeota archaeon]